MATVTAESVEVNVLVSEMTLLRQEMNALRSEVRQLIEAVRELPRPNNTGAFTAAEQHLAFAFSQKALAMPEVEAVAYRRRQRGGLEICTLLSTHEIEPEQAVIELELEMQNKLLAIKTDGTVQAGQRRDSSLRSE